MTVTLLQGDCRDVLHSLPSESVHCVVTSPPYWGLRDYGTAKWQGGDPGCDHRQFAYPPGRETPGGRKGSMPMSEKVFREICGKCGAHRIDSQIGLEQTPEQYTGELVAVFREVRRVLRKDGTVWLNLGDSYSGSGKGGNPDEGKQATNKGSQSIGLLYGKTAETARHAAVTNVSRRLTAELGFPPKQLMGIPWRIAFALQADGWWLRQDIIWSKPNPMPESVTDRCTKAHEYLFLLSKSERYYYDAEAIKEPANPSYFSRYDYAFNVGAKEANGAGRPSGASNTGGMKELHETRNKRSVWEIATSPFSEAHFATFPPMLIEPCIMAGCPKECCAKCGAPWMRLTERTQPTYWQQRKEHDYNGRKAENGPNDNYKSISRGRSDNSGVGYNHKKTLGFSPSCSCNAGIAPGVVLDPFGGAGTTGLVADRLGRNAILIELNPKYAAMAERRIRDDAGMFANVTGMEAAE